MRSKLVGITAEYSRIAWNTESEETIRNLLTGDLIEVN